MIKKFIDKLIAGTTGRKPRFGKRQEVGPEQMVLARDLVEGLGPKAVGQGARRFWRQARCLE